MAYRPNVDATINGINDVETCRVFFLHFLTWGAVQKLSTLEGYGLLARRTQNPVLAELLRRIIKDERRHFSFYYNKARAHLKARGAQRLTSFLIRRFWTPVGEGVKAHEETNWMLQFLFSDAYGRKAAERIDSTMRQPPGLEWFDLLSSKVSSVPGRVHRSDPQDPQYRWTAATDYLKCPPQSVEQE